MNNVKIVLRDKNCLPIKSHETDAGFDLKSLNHYIINPNQRQLVDTGINIKLPQQEGWIWQAQIRPRSGLAAKKGITVTNSPGTIDQNYIGNIKVIIQNTGDEVFEINQYDRIAQIVFNKIPITQFEIVQQLEESDRGNNGFGSSGI